MAISISGFLPIGANGGSHVANYHRDATTGNVPAPIQAGNIYGPVAFVSSNRNPVAAPTPQRLGKYIGGYTGNAGSPYTTAER